MRRVVRAVVAGLVGVTGAAPVLVLARPAMAAQTGDGETWRASISSTGQQGAFGSTRARISQDGRHVAYLTKSELVPGDTDLLDIYWTDMTDPSHPVTRRVSTSYTGGARQRPGRVRRPQRGRQQGRVLDAGHATPCRAWARARSCAT